jgi:hypothetical protein
MKGKIIIISCITVIIIPIVSLAIYNNYYQNKISKLDYEIHNYDQKLDSVLHTCNFEIRDPDQNLQELKIYNYAAIRNIYNTLINNNKIDVDGLEDFLNAIEGNPDNIPYDNPPILGGSDWRRIKIEERSRILNGFRHPLWSLIMGDMDDKEKGVARERIRERYFSYLRERYNEYCDSHKSILNKDVVYLITDEYKIYSLIETREKYYKKIIFFKKPLNVTALSMKQKLNEIKLKSKLIWNKDTTDETNSTELGRKRRNRNFPK